MHRIAPKPMMQAFLRDPKTWKGIVPELQPGGGPEAALAGGAGQLYCQLPRGVQVVVRPYLESKFTLEDVGSRAAAAAAAAAAGGAAADGGAVATSVVATLPVVPQIIFGRQRHSFRRWLELWLKAMSKMVTGQHQAAFSAVTSVLKWDLPLMMFLLPQVSPLEGMPP